MGCTERVQVSSQFPAQRPTTASQLTMGNTSPSPFESDNDYSTKPPIDLVATKYLTIAMTVATAMGTATVAMVPPRNVALGYSSPYGRVFNADQEYGQLPGVESGFGFGQRDGFEAAQQDWDWPLFRLGPRWPSRI